jgi:uncharacterized BrkB/YihY/UPF0761 family membrane protein
MTDPGKFRVGGFDPRLNIGRVWANQPRTPGRIALVVFGIILAIPLLLFILVAMAISVAVFLVLAGWNRLFGRRGPDWSTHDEEGRKGVRVRR